MLVIGLDICVWEGKNKNFHFYPDTSVLELEMGYKNPK